MANRRDMSHNGSPCSVSVVSGRADCTIFRETLLRVSVLIGAMLLFAGAGAVPASARHNVVVVGDSIGANLADGLRWALRGNRGYRVYKATKPGSGLVRPDNYDWNRAARRIIRRRKPTTLVVMIGGNDRQDMIVRGRRLERFSQAWYREYRKRVGKFANILSASRARIIWVGLPRVRSGKMTRDYAKFNEIFRATARRIGARYVPTRGVLGGGTGAYRKSGTGVNGRRVTLRKDDGIHLTRAGSRLIGRYVARRIAGR
jgi:hypothetical protein